MIERFTYKRTSSYITSGYGCNQQVETISDRASGSAGAYRHSIATVTLGGSLGEKLAAAAAAGFDGIELFEPDLIASPLAPEEVRRRLEDLGLVLELYQPVRDFEAVRPDQFQRNLRRVVSKLDLMQRLGAPMALVCSNVSPHALDDDDLAAEQLHAIATQARERGLKIAYEALAWGTRVNDYPHSWRIVQRADHPSLGLCLDSFHILAHGTRLDEIAAIPHDKLFIVQLSDAPKLRMDELQWSRHFRCFPGQGAFDLVSFVDRVLAAGYEGPLSLEVFNDIFRQADPFRTAVDGRRSLLWLEEGVATRAAALNSRPRKRSSQPHQTAAVMPSPGLRGFAFVEFHTPDAVTRQVERLLAGLGFGRVGLHRTKPVALWEAGNARILLNSARRPATGPSGFALAAVGIEADNAGFVANRATALRVPLIPRRRNWDEADLTAIEAPGGTEILLCGHDDEGGSWRGDFDPCDSGSPFHARTRLTSIDHVAFSQRLTLFHETAMFYRSLLGLTPLEAQELASPHGLMRSQAFAGGGEVRFIINVPVLGGGAQGQPEPAQHVAIRSSDIVETARAVTAQGLAILPIPRNYYDDLRARLELDPGSLEMYRRYNILYDEDTDGRVFRHFYVTLPQSSVLFEIVNRGPGYMGFGTGNAVIRMNAQELGRS